MRQLSSQNYISHHVGGYCLMWTQNVPQWEQGVVIPGFCVPNFNKTRKHTHWLARASKWPHEFTSCQQRNYINLIWEIHRHTQAIAKECLIFPSQWNCYQLSKNDRFQEHQKLWNRMNHSGKTFISAKVFRGTKQYTFHSWNWRQKVRATQGWSSSDFRNEPNSYKSLMENWTTNFTHTQTHTHELVRF
jgi:hypothetical protein